MNVIIEIIETVDAKLGEPTEFIYWFNGKCISNVRNMVPDQNDRLWSLEITIRDSTGNVVKFFQGEADSPPVAVRLEPPQDSGKNT